MKSHEANRMLSEIKSVKELQARQDKEGNRFLKVIIDKDECTEDDKIKLHNIKSNVEGLKRIDFDYTKNKNYK